MPRESQEQKGRRQLEEQLHAQQADLRRGYEAERRKAAPLMHQMEQDAAAMGLASESFNKRPKASKLESKSSKKRFKKSRREEAGFPSDMDPEPGFLTLTGRAIARGLSAMGRGIARPFLWMGRGFAAMGRGIASFFTKEVDDPVDYAAQGQQASTSAREARGRRSPSESIEPPNTSERPLSSERVRGKVRSHQSSEQGHSSKARKTLGLAEGNLAKTQKVERRSEELEGHARSFAATAKKLREREQNKNSGGGLVRSRR